MLFATLHVTVKDVVTDPDGIQEVVQHRYRYGKDNLGREGFLDGAGVLYAGQDTFIARVTEALRAIGHEGETGRVLIAYLENAPDSTDIAISFINGADMENGAYVFWNPSCLGSAPDQRGDTIRPAFIGLAHELAHISDVWHGTINRNTWMKLPDEEGGYVTVSYAELYATHIENKIRSENGLPLRVSYAKVFFDSWQRDVSSLLLKPGTRESLYFDREGHTAYRRLKRGEVPMVY